MKLGPENAGKNYCGCGWPHHCLVPRGTTQGMEFQLFVVATDWKVDQIESADILQKVSWCSFLL